MSLIFKNRKVYAVVISYNSSAVLGKLYERINKDIFDKIFFFDDSSIDGSAEKAKKYKDGIKDEIGQPVGTSRRLFTTQNFQYQEYKY